MDIEIEIFNNYKAAVKVIESCVTSEHIRGAQNYVNNFLKLYSIPSLANTITTNFYKSEIRDSHELPSMMYQQLLIELDNIDDVCENDSFIIVGILLDQESLVSLHALRSTSVMKI